VAAIIINPSDWQLRTPAEGGVQSTSHNGAALLGDDYLSAASAPRSQLLRDANPFLVILEEPPNHHSPVHSHSEPELMVVLKGKMLLNGVWCYPGAIIFYEANQHYWHSTGEEGCVTALMRPGDRGYMHLTPEANPATNEARS
jgi:hypothetical protein